MTEQGALFDVPSKELSVPDGTPLQEAVSALIKEMRRAKPTEAMYWARQIETRYSGYLWRRLAIFACEDVSIANIDAVTTVRVLHEYWERATGKERGETVKRNPTGGSRAVEAAVYMLTTSRKCRESNFLYGMAGDLRKSGWRPEGEGLIVDRFVQAVEAGDDLVAVTHARELHKSQGSKVWDPLMDWATEHIAATEPAAFAALSACRWGYLLVEKSSGRKEGDHDCLSMGVMLACRAEASTAPRDVWYDLRERIANGEEFEVPEYALDGHTKRGKQRIPVSRDRHRNWFMEASVVIPNVGPHDVELWHLRRIAGDGMVEPEYVEALADEWRREGSLVWPAEDRYPVIEGWRHP